MYLASGSLYLKASSFPKCVEVNISLRDTCQGNYIFENDKDFGNGEYIGEWKQGNFYGQGIMKFNNGDIYEGAWVANEMHGLGKMTYSDGSIYEGRWEDNLPNGKGKMTYSDSSVYEGNWREGYRYGYGKITYKDKQIVEGEFDNGLFGNGIYKLSNIVDLKHFINYWFIKKNYYKNKN